MELSVPVSKAGSGSDQVVLCGSFDFHLQSQKDFKGRNSSDSYLNLAWPLKLQPRFALQLFEYMPVAKVTPDLVSYKAALRACEAGGLRELSLRLLKSSSVV